MGKNTEGDNETKANEARTHRTQGKGGGWVRKKKNKDMKTKWEDHAQGQTQKALKDTEIRNVKSKQNKEKKHLNKMLDIITRKEKGYTTYV